MHIKGKSLSSGDLQLKPPSKLKTKHFKIKREILPYKIQVTKPEFRTSSQPYMNL